MCAKFIKRRKASLHTLSQLLPQYDKTSFLIKSSDFLSDCKHALNDSFGHLNITYNGSYFQDCTWKLGNSGMSEPVAIVSIEQVQFGSCR